MSSLKPEHAVSDYSGLSETDLKVLNDWFEFFKYVTTFSLVMHPVNVFVCVGNDTTSLVASL